MIVSCLYLRLSREFNAELEIKTHSHLHDQNQKPDIWLIDKCKTIDVGVTLPRQTGRYCNEKLKKYRDGTPDRLRDGRDPPPSPAAPRSSTWMSEALDPGRPATAYMAAKASEHLTAGPARARRAGHPATPLSAHF